ncbi:MAG: hypothetical protein SVM86_04960 [Candidatus Cloacimonadota bacterium]|nr:hypothetical protein [Candidatus Cloacimonadota bacterium]
MKKIKWSSLLIVLFLYFCVLTPKYNKIIQQKDYDFYGPNRESLVYFPLNTKANKFTLSLPSNKNIIDTVYQQTMFEKNKL